MAEASLHRGNAHMIDYTPTVAVSAGQVILLGGQAYVAHRDIAANALGALSAPNGAVEYKVQKLAVDADAYAIGDPVDWEDTANKALPTTTGTGHFGYCSSPAAATDTFVYCTLERKGA